MCCKELWLLAEPLSILLDYRNEMGQRLPDYQTVWTVRVSSERFDSLPLLKEVSWLYTYLYNQTHL